MKEAIAAKRGIGVATEIQRDNRDDRTTARGLVRNPGRFVDKLRVGRLRVGRGVFVKRSDLNRHAFE